MKKKIFVICIVLTCVVGIVGCKSDDKNKTVDSNSSDNHVAKPIITRAPESGDKTKEETDSNPRDEGMGDPSLNRIVDIMSEFGGYRDVKLAENMHVKTFDEFDSKTFDEYVQKLKDAGFTKDIKTKTDEPNAKMFYSAGDGAGLRCDLIVKPGESRLAVYAK